MLKTLKQATQKAIPEVKINPIVISPLHTSMTWPNEQTTAAYLLLGDATSLDHHHPGTSRNDEFPTLSSSVFQIGTLKPKTALPLSEMSDTYIWD